MSSTAKSDPSSGTVVLKPKQHETVHKVFSGVPNTGFIGGLGSGKTVVGSVITVSLAQQYPGIRILLAAPTYDQISQGSLKTFEEWFAPIIVSHNRTDHVIKFPWTDDRGNPSELVYRSTTDIDRIRAHEYGAGWWDESGMSPGHARAVIRGRMRSRRGVPDGWHYPIFETTTPRGRNHLWRAFSKDQLPGESKAEYDRRQKRFQAVSASTFENADNLPEDYIDDIKASMHGDTRLIAQELEGMFVSFEGLVFPQFDEMLHVRPFEAPHPAGWDSPEVIQRVGGVDLGGGDPTGVLTIGRFRDGHVHVYDERRWDTPVGETEVAAYLFAAQGSAPLNAVWMSPENQFAITTLGAAGLPTGPRRPTKQRSGGQFEISARAINDRPQGIRLIGELLSTRKLTIAPHCIRLISEFNTYLWKEARDGQGNTVNTSTPNEHHADLIDALRYALMGMFTVPVGSSPAGARAPRSRRPGVRVARPRHAA